MGDGDAGKELALLTGVVVGLGVVVGTAVGIVVVPVAGTVQTDAALPTACCLILPSTCGLHQMRRSVPIQDIGP